LCCPCLQPQHPWYLAVQDLETQFQSSILADFDGLLVSLRAAVIVKEQWIYVCNLDESPAACDIFSPFACSYIGVCRGWLAENSLCQECSMVLKAGQGLFAQKPAQSTQQDCCHLEAE